MKHVNTMQMEELSDDQIAAARARRSKERSTQPHLLMLIALCCCIETWIGKYCTMLLRQQLNGV